MQSENTYNYTVVRQFAIMTVIWGVVGMLVGVIIAAQLIWPELNLAPWLAEAGQQRLRRGKFDIDQKRSRRDYLPCIRQPRKYHVMNDQASCNDNRD